MKRLKVSLIAALMLALATPTLAQEATPEPTLWVETAIPAPTAIPTPTAEIDDDAPAQGWLIYVVIVVAVLVIGFLLYKLIQYVATFLTPEQARASADAFERGWRGGQAASQRSTNPYDNLVFDLGDPLVVAALEVLRERAKQIPSAPTPPPDSTSTPTWDELRRRGGTDTPPTGFPRPGEPH